jgi:SAM-dependent methyltransferase
MEQVVCKRAASVEFWDGYAPWYKLWMAHTRYHDRIIDFLMAKAEPGWKVLDIGAGNGVLSLPLCAIGCEVTALEPSVGMRNLLFAEAYARGTDWLRVDERSWEEVPAHSSRDFDLIMACNSLHLTGTGLQSALNKVFRFRPRHIFLVSELYPGIGGLPEREDYTLRFTEYFETESSFAYHHIGEVIDHWTFKKGGNLSDQELRDIPTLLTYRDDHVWIKDNATVGMFWWERQNILER